MKKVKLFLVFAFSLLLLVNYSFAQDTKVKRSPKRGVCINKMTENEAKTLSQGVSWFYNWHWKTEYKYLSVDMEYFPMVWGAKPENLTDFVKELEKGAKPTHVLVLNEPNLKDQAFVSPEVAAKAYLEAEKVANKHGIKIIGPHMALGSGADKSITALDPIENKQVTYTFMIPYLNAFYHFVGGVDKIDAIAVHSYGNIGELKWMIKMLQEKYPGKPIWITEFAWWGAKNAGQTYLYMKEAVELFEKTPAVEKYAWFKAHMGNGNRMSLLSDDGKLTKLGKAYISFPFYDPETQKMIQTGNKEDTP